MLLLLFTVVLWSDKANGSLYSLPLLVSDGDNPVYFVHVEIGTGPPQNMKVLFDLNNPNCAVPIGPYCNTNPHCYGNSTFYPDQSPTATIMKCDSSCQSCSNIHDPEEDKSQESCSISLYFNQNSILQASSSRCIVIQDTFSVGVSLDNFGFGGIYEESQDSEIYQSNGVLGFGPSSSTNSNLDSWFGNLVSDDMVTGNIFSFCMDFNGGILILGGNDLSLFSGVLSYTPLTSSDRYTLSSNEMDVDGQPLDVQEHYLNPVILDTTGGSTILGVQIFKAFTQQIQSLYCQRKTIPTGLCGEKTLFNGHCFPIGVETFDNYPGVSFVLQGGVNLTMTPQYYLYQKDGYFCSSIIEGSTYQTGIILGTNILRRYYVTFDLGGKVVGFSPSIGCSEATYVLEYLSGNDQTAPIGTALENELLAVVKSFDSNLPIEGITVHWTVNEGNGHFKSLTTVSDENGRVSATVVIGDEIGTNIITVSLDRAIGSPIIYQATGVKGAYFYVTNSLALVGLSFALGVIIFYQKVFHGKKDLHEEVKEKMNELSGRTINDDIIEPESESLLDWGDDPNEMKEDADHLLSHLDE